MARIAEGRSMTRRDTSGDAAWAMMVGDDLPDVTLTGAQMRIIQRALEEAESVLQKSENSKIYSVAKAARSARATVLHAWAIVRPKVSK
jgi:hypothetical protein